MSKHIYNKIQQLKQEYRINSVKIILRNQHSEIWEDVFNHFPFLDESATIPEILYCIENELTERPTCVCGKGTTWSRGVVRYSEFCSNKCANPYRFERAHKTLGVENVSQLKSVKEKKKKKALEKYGVDNVSKAKEVKEVIAKKALERWDERFEGKTIHANGMTKKEYTRAAYNYSNVVYNRNKDKIDPKGLHSKEWHVDHIYSISDGFQNDVPINVISDISNLRIICAFDNNSKNLNSDKTLEQLYEDYKKENGH